MILKGNLGREKWDRVHGWSVMDDGVGDADDKANTHTHTPSLVNAVA